MKTSGHFSAKLLPMKVGLLKMALAGGALALACGQSGGTSLAPDASADSPDDGSRADRALGGGGGAGEAGGDAAAGSGGGGTGGRFVAGGEAGGSAGRFVVGGAAGTQGDAGAPGGSTATCARCATYAEPAQTGTVGITELDALSGLAVSRLQPEIFFAHNDHDRAVIYALDLQGREHARITLTGAAATDLEDIALGPCGSTSCLFLGDIGDNNAQRSEYAILRLPVPTVPASPGSSAMSPSFERFRFTYEDGSHNAEGLMIGPDGTVYVVTKLAPGSGGRVAATGPSSIYRLPSSMTTTSVAKATKVATLSVPAGSDLAASGAAAHPCGIGFLLRTYDKVYEFTAPAGQGFEAAFTTTPKVVATPSEPQSEGIDYRADGRGFITSGEGAHAPIMQVGCTP